MQPAAIATPYPPPNAAAVAAYDDDDDGYELQLSASGLFQKKKQGKTNRQTRSLIECDSAVRRNIALVISVLLTLHGVHGGFSVFGESCKGFGHKTKKYILAHINPGQNVVCVLFFLSFKTAARLRRRPVEYYPIIKFYTPQDV